MKPDALEMGKGMALPACTDCDSDSYMQAIGIIGAIIMPHNLYLHSALVKSRKVDNKNSKETKDANRYILIESAIALFISFLINLSVTTVFAKGLNSKSNTDVYEICQNYSNVHSFIDMDALSNDNDTFASDLYTSGMYLGCQFGALPFYIWAIGILAAGQSSTMTGTYSGQFAMEGFLNLSWPRWKRVLLTRSIAIAPTLAVTVSSSMSTLNGMNDYLNALMVMQLPFAVLPTLTFSSSKLVMGEKFVNNIFYTIVATILSIVVVAINIYSGVTVILGLPFNEYILYSVSAIFGTLYIIFILYLVSSKNFISFTLKKLKKNGFLCFHRPVATSVSWDLFTMRNCR